MPKTKTPPNPVLSILSEVLAPAAAASIADRINVAVSQSAAPKGMEQATALLTQALALLGSQPAAVRGAAPVATAASGARRGRPPKAKNAPVKAQKGKLGLSAGAQNIVSLRASLRWAKHRVANGTPQDGDEALIKRLTKQLAGADKVAPAKRGKGKGTAKASASSANGVVGSPPAIPSGLPAGLGG